MNRACVETMDDVSLYKVVRSLFNVRTEREAQYWMRGLAISTSTVFVALMRKRALRQN